MQATSLDLRLRELGPKRLLALDGGGIRGLITLGFLSRIEAILRERLRRPDLVLSDYFDLIGGTSTGAIIAALLALGRPVEEIHRLYLSLGREAFRPRKSWFGPLGRLVGAKFDERPLETLLRGRLGERTLDSADLQVGLMIIVKRVDTGSPWVLLNIPGHRFYESNRNLPLWEVVRASTAAPTFFSPKVVTDVGGGEEAVFVDGAVSMHVNPALQLLMVATLEGFTLRWPLGEDRLLLCSVGTGRFRRLVSKEALGHYSNLHWLALLATQMMQDASEMTETLLQWLGRSPTARRIDRQIGDLSGDALTASPALHYLRYEVDLGKEALSGLDLHFDEARIESLRKMSEVRNIADLDRIGAAAAGVHIHPDHFPPVFDRGLPAHP